MRPDHVSRVLTVHVCPTPRKGSLRSRRYESSPSSPVVARTDGWTFRRKLSTTTTTNSWPFPRSLRPYPRPPLYHGSQSEGKPYTRPPRRTGSRNLRTDCSQVGRPGAPDGNDELNYAQTVGLQRGRRRRRQESGDPPYTKNTGNIPYPHGEGDPWVPVKKKHTLFLKQPRVDSPKLGRQRGPVGTRGRTG